MQMLVVFFLYLYIGLNCLNQMNNVGKCMKTGTGDVLSPPKKFSHVVNVCEISEECLTGM